MKMVFLYVAATFFGISASASPANSGGTAGYCKSTPLCGHDKESAIDLNVRRTLVCEWDWSGNEQDFVQGNIYTIYSAVSQIAHDLSLCGYHVDLRYPAFQKLKSQMDYASQIREFVSVRTK